MHRVDRYLNILVNILLVAILHFGVCFLVGFFLPPNYFLNKEEVFSMDILAMCPNYIFSLAHPMVLLR